MKIKEGKTYLTVPHAGGELSFQYPAFKGTYGNIGEQIDEAGLKRPNSPKTASLVYDAWQNKEGKYESEIISILKINWLWEFTGNLYLPKREGEEFHNGVIIEYNPKIENRKLIMDKNSLVKRLKENDSQVKFVPFGYKIGEQPWQELEKNEYIVERYGKEGAGKLAEIASEYTGNHDIWSFKSVKEEKMRMSALDWGWGFDGRLSVDGDNWDDDYQGYAFGVCRKNKEDFARLN